MAINEVFPNPTVKQVVFQIRFPNLFYVEDKIGNLQVRIMEEFPESALVFRRHLVLANLGPGVKLEDISDRINEEDVRRVWQFKSPKKFELNVTSNSLDINSQYHKTYNLGDGDKFRDTIEFVLKHFLEVMGIPVINRVGLRYIDECPIPVKSDKEFTSYYNSTFPLERFSLVKTEEMDFKAVIRRDGLFLRYAESLRKRDNEYRLFLDFDGFMTDVAAENCLPTTDDLHALISSEYERTIKEPVYQYMRETKEE